MRIYTLMFSSLASLLFAGGAVAQNCPEAPQWLVVKEGQPHCSYAVANPGQFNDAAFVSFLDRLSHDASPGLKRVTLPAGTYAFSRSIQISGANGWLVQIQGEGSAATRLVFHNVHGINLEGPFALGLVSKLTLNGNGRKGMENNPLSDKYGVLARRGGNIRLGEDVVVEEFSRAGIQAFMSSVIYAKGAVSRNNGSDGFVASYNSTVYAQGSVASGNRGDGFFAEATSTIFAEESAAIGNVIDRAKGQSRGGDGYVARLGGIINADGAKVQDNEDNDFVAIEQSTISARNVKATKKLKVYTRDNGLLLSK